MSSASLNTLVEEIMHDVMAESQVGRDLERIREHNGDIFYFHGISVGYWTTKLALMNGFERHYGTDIIKSIGRGGLLHDLGKIRVPRTILEKGFDEKLTDQEWAIVRMHPRWSHEELRDNYGPIESNMGVGHHEHQDNPYPRTPIRAEIAAALKVLNNPQSLNNMKKRQNNPLYTITQMMCAAADRRDSLLPRFQELKRPYQKVKTEQEAFALMVDGYKGYPLYMKQLIDPTETNLVPEGMRKRISGPTSAVQQDLAEYHEPQSPSQQSYRASDPTLPTASAVA